jgi:hypothetical protein
MTQPEDDPRWFSTDDRFTANLKMLILLVACELVAVVLVFLIPVYLHKMSPITMAVPLIAGTMMIAILFGLKYKVDNSRDGTGRGGSPLLILGITILINVGALGSRFFSELLDHGLVKFSPQMLVIVLIVPFIAFTGILLYYIVLTEGWE